MDEVPFPDRGFVPKGVVYRLPSTTREPRRQLPAEVLKLIRRHEEATIREYLKRRRVS